MAVGIKSPTFIFMIVGLVQSSGSVSASNFSRNFVAAISTSVPSTYIIIIVDKLSAEVDEIESTPGTDMIADSSGRVTSSSMSSGAAPL